MNKIYIGNLDYKMTEQELEETFSSYGSIQEVKLIKDHTTGQSKGFAFLTFNDADSAQGALQKDGEELNGRKLRVNIARERNS